jgi:hypothetical protein
LNKNAKAIAYPDHGLIIIRRARKNNLKNAVQLIRK